MNWKWALGGVLVVALAMRLVFFAGLRGSDDLRYVELAQAQAQGIPAIPPGTPLWDWATRRPAINTIVAQFIRVWGISEATLMAYPMACSLGITALLFLAVHRWVGLAPAVGVGLVAACLPGYVLAASSLYPDLPPAAWIALAFVLLWGAPEWPRWGTLAAAGAGAAYGFAIHHKETALLLFPCLLWLLLTPGRRRFLMWTLPPIVAWLWLGWGGYLPEEVTAYFRMHLEPPEDWKGSVYDPLLNPTLNASPSMARRLLWDFTCILINPLNAGGFSMWAGLAWLATGGAWLAVKERSKPLLACSAWALLGFLAMNCAGIPGTGYFPVHPVSPRYLGLVLPPAVVLAGCFLAWTWGQLGRMGRWGMVAIALPVVLLFNEMTVTPNRDFARALRLSIPILKAAAPAEVWTDRRTAEGLEAFLGEALRTHELKDGTAVPAGGLVVVNGPKLDKLAKDYNQPLPGALIKPPAGWTLLASRHVLGVFGKGAGLPERRVSVYRVDAVPTQAKPSGASRPGAAPSMLAMAAAVPDSLGITPRQRTVAALFSVGLIVFIFELVRRRRLREEYSWLWMLSGGVILVFALYHPALQWVTALIGAGLPTSTLFFFGFFFLILICIHYAVKISTLTMQLKNLMQELAMLKEQKERESGEKRSS